MGEPYPDPETARELGTRKASLKGIERGKYFIDRIEDNGVAVLIDPSGKTHDVPAMKGWKEGQYIAHPGPAAPPAAKPGEAAGFYLAPPTGMDPTANPAPVIGDGRKMDTGSGQYLDNHEPVPAAALRASESQPWNWYAGGPVPNPTPSFRLPTDMAGPAPPVAAGPAGGAGQAMVAMPSERGRARHRRSRPVP